MTRSPKNGRRNVGCYRMQVFDERTTGMHWQVHKGGAEHFRWLERQGKGRRMEVAVALGADPATMLSGVLPLPEDLDEFLFAGFLRQQPVELVKCETVDLEVPAQAEIVLEGYVDLDDIRTEGPFGDHTGYYSLEDKFPAFHITCITRRRDPIYVSTIVGRPPMEDYWMGYAVERLFLPLMRKQMPEVVDMHMPAEGVFHNLMMVAIRKSYPGHARKVMNAIWGMPGAMFTKCIRGGGPRCERARLRRSRLESPEPHRPRARYSVHARPRGPTRTRLAPAQLRLQDGHRRHAQMAHRRLYPPLAG